jgi:hypothetical protein
MNKLFLGCCEGYSESDVVNFIANEFEVSKEEISCYEFYIAVNDQEDYEGSAYFLMKHRETGEFYEASGSHCSCYGFEGQWEPKIAPKAYLISNHNSFSFLHDRDTIKEYIKRLFD